MDNTNSLMVKISISLLIIEFIGLLLVSFVGSTTLNNPSTNQINNISNSIRNQSRQISLVFNYSLISAQQPSSQGTFSIFGQIGYWIVQFFNFVAKILDFFLQLIIFLGIAIYEIIFVVFVLIPSIANSVAGGTFGFVYGLVGGLILLIAGYFAINLLLGLVGRIFGGKGGK